IATSASKHWWGGHSFGSRFTTGLVPWFVLLSILGVQAMLRHRQTVVSSPIRYRLELASAAVLLLLSVAINGLGAVNLATWVWNMEPSNIDYNDYRLWDWRQPQFLAGLVRPPLPAQIPELKFERVEFSQTAADVYIWYGWSKPEAELRWTESNAATLVFSQSKNQDILMTIALRPFVVA